MLRQRNRELEAQLEKASNGVSGAGPSQSLQARDGQGNQRTTTGHRATNSATSALSSTMMGSDPGNPSVLLMLDTLRRENEQLRGKLADTEREFVRVRRLNEVYREELIECRTRVSKPYTHVK